MKYTAIVAAFAAVASAQSVTSTSWAGTATSSCAAQNILDACKATIQGQVNSCSQQDWGCLCEQYGNLITCYNNCPGNLEVSSVQQQRDQYCNFASVYSSSTTKYSAVSTSATATSTSSSDDVAQTGFAAASGSESAKASTTASGNSAAATQIAANIAFAGVAVAYMFL